MRKTLLRMRADALEFAIAHKRYWPHAATSLVLLVILLVVNAHERISVYHREISSDFEDARIFGSNTKAIYEGKDALFNKNLRQLQESQDRLLETTQKLQKKIDDMEKSPQPVAGTQQVSITPTENTINVHPSTVSEEAQNGNQLPSQAFTSAKRERSSGRSIISFPVKEVAKQDDSVTLPSGSYVKAKLMTGVAAPEGRTYPVLLQLDFAFVMPNKTKLDLAGCFMIAKSQGDLSTERVQMQATKLSCVSKQGKMFEREVNGFVADDKDNSFAVSGIVHSKQDRVATMAFLSSIVEGVGKAIQQAQTTQQTNALGGSQSIVTGDQASYMAAGGASQAAGMVTQWYLKQAQNLLPTINVGSGQDVWIVMHDSVKLPNSYFAKNTHTEDSTSYLYFSRLTE